MDPVTQTTRAIERLRVLLHPVFEDVLAEHARARGRRRSLNHRLAMAVSEWLAAQRRSEVALGWAIEIDIAARLFDKWSTHPIWDSEMRPSLRNPPDYPHALFTLAAAAELQGQPVPAGPVRSPDVAVPDVDGTTAYRVEVKAPRPLQAPYPNLEGDRARRIVQRCVSNAGSTKGGQLHGPEPVLLAIGGFHLNHGQVERLVLGAQRELNAVPRPHFPGILLLHWYCLVDGVLVDGRTRRLEANSTVHGVLRKQWVPNPTYSGPFRLEVVPAGPDFARLNEHPPLSRDEW